MGIPARTGSRDLAHDRALVDGQKDEDVGIGPGNGGQGPGHSGDWLTPRLPPVHGDEDQRALVGIQVVEYDRFRPSGSGAGERPVECIDHRVAGAQHASRVDALGHQVGGRRRGRGEVEGGQLGDETAIGLFWIGRQRISGAQPGFDVSDRHPGVEAGQGGRERRRGVALEDDEVRLNLSDDSRETLEGLRVTSPRL